MDRLTNEDTYLAERLADIERGVWEAKTEVKVICGLAAARIRKLQSLSQEAVRDEADLDSVVSARNETLEEAARVCDAKAEEYSFRSSWNLVRYVRAWQAQEDAEAIRALKREPNAAAAEGPAHGLPCWPVDRPAPAVVELIAQLHDMAFALEKQGSEHWAMNCGYAAALLAKLGQAQPRMKLYQLCEKHKGITSYRVKVSSATFPSETVCPVCEEPTPGASDD